MLPSIVMSPRLSSSQVPAPIRDVLRRLHDSGHKAYVIGGAVRELLVGEKPAPQDWDLGTSATPEEVLGRVGMVDKIFTISDGKEPITCLGPSRAQLLALVA